ncbi:SpoIIE family protein phosphatase [Streptomyces zagrosensis]|uniref:protein-serine/threonine phosphatase n=1 Tax=Streptomyces zagrosensis TaxID=1042984 RepID=A0A7W9Q761_9ACTN|nr:SpoIIE family protein phosphatase [Streptomyces zagrosensis]MBB5934883.1 PAS domain S-box-containing protein [Streptomyces zagrosensis]
MGNPDPPKAQSRHFPQRSESVASARRFVRTALGGAAPHVVDTAQLLVSELVTNAVLHAATDVHVSVRTVGSRVCVQVSDARPARCLTPRKSPPYAGTGQGLAMVELLAYRHGFESGEDHKTVWFELRSDGLPPPSSGWQPALPASFSSRETVMLVDMPSTLYSASEQHRHALLGELALAASAGDGLGVEPEDLAAAHDMNNVISACVTAALKQHPPLTDIHSLPLPVPADAAPSMAALRQVLELAETAAREERLLTLPALPRSRAFQQWLLDQIIGQLNGGSPTAWTLVPHEPGVSPSELVPWDHSHVRASRVPTIAADETNRIVAANGPAADLLGWKADELVGHRLTTIVPEHLRQRHISAFTSLLLTGQARILGRSVPLPALHHDGHLVPVRLIIQTQETTDGRTVFVAQLAPRATEPVHAQSAPEKGQPSAPQEPGGPYRPIVPERDSRPSGSDTDMSALERLTLLAGIGNALSNTMNLHEGLQSVGRILTQQLADWCAVDLLDNHAQVDRACVVHRRPPQGLLPQEYEGRLPPMSQVARGPLARVLRGAGPLLLTEAPPPPQTESPLDTQYVELLEQLGTTSAIIAPLRARREIFGALTVARMGADRPFTADELSLVDDVVRTLALGVDNARLYQDTRNVAERLQHSLLPKLPVVEHLQLAARYVASSATAQVGGDWYDSFLVSEGTALVIGDVTGHNLDAVVMMGQLRSMLRGIAIDRQEPPQAVLRRLDLANHSLYQEATATCLYGLLKGPAHGPWEFHFSSAGHLPPLLTTAEGDTCYLEDGAGLLLGMDPDMPRPDGTSDLPPHSTLLLYTDGLIERRGESLDHAMARLRRLTATLAREPLDVFCDELLIGLGADNADDLAILAVRPTPPS